MKTKDLITYYTKFILSGYRNKQLKILEPELRIRKRPDRQKNQIRIQFLNFGFGSWSDSDGKPQYGTNLIKLKTPYFIHYFSLSICLYIYYLLTVGKIEIFNMLLFYFNLKLNFVHIPRSWAWKKDPGLMPATDMLRRGYWSTTSSSSSAS